MMLTLWPFILLALAVLSSYLPVRPWVIGRSRVPLWVFFIIASAVGAFVSGVASSLALCWLAMLFAAVLLYRQVRGGWHRELLYASILILAFLLLIQKLPGFREVMVYEHVIFGTHVYADSLHLYYGRAFAGVLLFCALAHRIKSREDLCSALWDARKVPLFILAYFGLGVILWYVPDPKFNIHVIQYLVVNLFFISLVDEAFFRLLVQDRLEHFLGGRNAENMYLAAVITTVLFALSYYIHGMPVEHAILIFIAGLLYAYAYGKTRRVEISILAHFVVDGIVIVGFLYP